MGTLFSFIAFFSFAGLVVGLIKPKVFSRFVKEVPKRKIIALVFGGAMIFSGLLGEAVAPDKPEVVDSQNNQVVEQQVSQSDDNQEQEATEEEIVEENEPAQNESDQTVSNPQKPQPQQTTQPSQPTSQLFSVVKVVDGDTIKVDINGTTETLRLIGIDTPETVDPRKPVECFGIEASNKAKELLIGKKVRLESDSASGERGIYGRLLRYVWLEDGTFFNKKMISEGYAFEYTYNTSYKYQTEFKQAEKEARENKRGLWADDACLQEEQQEADQTSPPADPSVHTFYLSTYHTATYYYCDTDEAWKGLSEKYLESYSSEAELLAKNPGRILHEPCQ